MGKVSEADIIADEIKNGDYSRFSLLQTLCIFVPKNICDIASKIGIEEADLRQEASIALLSSLHTFKPGDTGFKTYSSVCIRNRLVSIIRNGYRQKNLAMAGYISLDDIDIVSENDPEKEYIQKEENESRKIQIQCVLSSFEKSVLGLYLKNMSYKDISNSLGVTEKSVENALSRIRKKLR